MEEKKKKKESNYPTFSPVKIGFSFPDILDTLAFWGEREKMDSLLRARFGDHQSKKQSVSKMPVKTRKSKNKIEK